MVVYGLPVGFEGLADPPADWRQKGLGGDTAGAVSSSAAGAAAPSSGPAPRARPAELPALVKLNDAPAGPPPLFLIPGIHMYAVHFAAAARALARESGTPVVGVELLTADAPLGSVEGLARWVVTLIEGWAPTGPVRVGGHSLGARVASEVVFQLEHTGRVVDLAVLIDDGPSFEPFGVAKTWSSLGESAEARIARFFSSWFVTAEASTPEAKEFFGRIPDMITSKSFDAVATRLQTMRKSDLHVSFATVAADGWESSASFWEQAWRVARFFERVSRGTLMSYEPTRTTDVPALLIRTADPARSVFRQWLSAVSDFANDPERDDFGAGAVFNRLAVHTIDDVTHFSIVKDGAADIARLVAQTSA